MPECKTSNVPTSEIGSAGRVGTKVPHENRVHRFDLQLVVRKSNRIFEFRFGIGEKCGKDRIYGEPFEISCVELRFGFRLSASDGANSDGFDHQFLLTSETEL